MTFSYSLHTTSIDGHLHIYLPNSAHLHPCPPLPTSKQSSLQAAQMVQVQPTSTDDALTTSGSTPPHAIFMGRPAACSSSPAAAASTLMLAETALLVEHERPKSPEYFGEEARRGRRRKKRRCRRRGSPENLMNRSCSDGFGIGVGSWATCNLSAGEEAECALCLKEGARLEATRSKLREMEKDPTMSQWANAVRMRKPTLEMALGRVRECKNRITRSYRRLVVSIATPYCGRGLTLHDLIQEGSIGLLRGAERFDHSKGNRLSTYVYWWIKQAVLKAVATKSRIVRLPGSMQGAMAKVAEANAILNERLGRLPSHEEVANMVGICEKRVRVICERSRSPCRWINP